MTSSGTDIVELDRIAVLEALRLVDRAKDGDWGRDTPCAGWDLRRLVAHMSAQHFGFAAAARGAGHDTAHWREPVDSDDPARVHRAAATAVLDAFAEPGVTGREFTLPELGGSFPARQAVRFHLVDYVVHAWDVAAALKVDLELPEDVLRAALAVARRVPADQASRGPGNAFAPALGVPDDSDPLHETLRLLGRDPRRWNPGVAGRGGAGTSA